MPRILTITANAAFDHFVEVDGLSWGEVVTARRSAVFPSGKGINVARAISGIGHFVTAIGLVGHESVGAFARLESGYLRMNLVSVAATTRTNITLLDVGSARNTHIRTPGSMVTPIDLNRLKQELMNSVSADDIVVVSGSLPEQAPPDTYPDLISECQRRGARVFFDSRDDDLRMGLEARPFLVKPNEDELGVLMGHCLRSEDEIVEAAYSLVSQGVRWVAVSRGEKGLILVGEKEVWTGRVTLDARAIGITAVGSGDAALGGMAVVFLENKSIESVVRWGVACGAANLLTLEPGACRLSDVERLLDEVQVHRTRSIGVS